MLKIFTEKAVIVKINCWAKKNHTLHQINIQTKKDVCKKKKKKSTCLSKTLSTFRKLHSDEVLCWWRASFRPVWVDLVFTSRILLPANMSTTINTFHSSFNPPPVPPRSGHRGPALPSNTPLVKFLSVMLLLLMIQTFGGFLYLFHRINTVGTRMLNGYELIMDQRFF